MLVPTSALLYIAEASEQDKKQYGAGCYVNYVTRSTGNADPGNAAVTGNTQGRVHHYLAGERIEVVERRINRRPWHLGRAAVLGAVTVVAAVGVAGAGSFLGSYIAGLVS